MVEKITENKYTDEEIEAILNKFGTVYLHKQITDRVEYIIGNDEQKDRFIDFFNALMNYKTFMEKLEVSNLIPNLTMLLYGPPGTGKTSLTRAFAKKYEVNVCVVEADRLVTSLLGETIKNIRKVVEAAADIAEINGPFVLFFDEIDAIGSERSNIHEVGEIKRAVVSFLQTIDRITYKGVELAIIGATNHQQQLDSAIWRRFTYHLEFDFPKYKLRAEILKSFINRIKRTGIGVDDSILSSISMELVKISSIAEDLGNDVNEDFLMEEVQKQNQNKLITLTHGYSGSDIERGTRVALFKAMGADPKKPQPLTYNMFSGSLELVGGTATHVERQEVLSSSNNISKDSEKSKLVEDFKEDIDENELESYLLKLKPVLEKIYYIFEKNDDFLTQSRGTNPIGKFYGIIEKLNKLKNG